MALVNGLPEHAKHSSDVARAAVSEALQLAFQDGDDAEGVKKAIASAASPLRVVIANAAAAPGADAVALGVHILNGAQVAVAINDELAPEAYQHAFAALYAPSADVSLVSKESLQAWARSGGEPAGRKDAVAATAAWIASL